MMKRTAWLIAGAIVLAAVIVATALVLTAPHQKDLPNEGDAATPPLSIDPRAALYVSPAPRTPEPGIVIPGYETLRLPAGETEAAVRLENPEANADHYYLTYEIRLEETDELLAATELIPPGQSVLEITLSHALEAGRYKAILHVQPYRMDASQSETNNANFETMLIVE